jgi:hypothetical protein
MAVSISDPMPKFKIGQVVYFKTANIQLSISLPPQSKNYTGSWRTHKNPALVVIEIVREDKKGMFSEDLGIPLRDNFKVLCQYCNSKTGLFEEKWFKESLLEELKPKEKHPDYEDKETQPPKIELIKKEPIALDKPTQITAALLSANVKFKGKGSPLMSIVGIVKDDDKKSKPLFNASREQQIRWTDESSYKIKCMYWNKIEAKFSEQFFYPSALQLLVKIPQTDKNAQ